MIVAVLGQALLLLALCAAACGSALGFAGGRRLTRDDPERRSAADGAVATGDRLAEGALRCCHVLVAATAAATFLLLLALVGSNYTLAYVAARTSNDLSFGFRLTALWSGQEGSLLLWLLLLSAFGMGMVATLRRARVPAALLAHATGVLLAVASFFALLVAVVARPFAVAERLQQDGSGMSPALQNYWMALHPPTLYLGYVGLAVPFAIVCGALLARRADDEWIVTTRRWLMASWTFLTLGLVLGARWAYEEIGWGGYWAWDPVENAALMPWLTATALLHSITVQQRRGMMRFWNAVLASLTFALSIFGTFITRSGVLSSVHSFVSSPVGWWFIGALAVLAAGILVLLYRSRTLLRARHDVDAVVSRESLLLFNNLLLVSLALVVLWGVVYPILTAALAEARISLEKPWYDFFATAFGLPLVALLSLAPLVAWRGTALWRVARGLALPLVAAVLLALVLIAAGLGSSTTAIAAISLSTLVLAVLAADVVATVAARRRVVPEERMRASLARVLTRNRRRWGAWTAHAGVALLVIAIAGGAWTQTVTRELQPGEVARVGPYELRLREVERTRSSTAMQTRAVFDVARGGEELGMLRAGRDFHPVSGEVSNEVGIRHDWLRLHDLFVSVDRLTEDGSAHVQLIVNPLVPLLWIAGLMMAIGAVIAAAPRRSRRPDGPAGRNGASRVQPPMDAVHELRNGAAAPRELLSGVRGASGRAHS